MKNHFPDFISGELIQLKGDSKITQPKMVTLFVSGGRRDKISKGDIAGFFFKVGKLDRNELGAIELKQECAFVAVHKSKVNKVISLVNNQRLKKKKVRVTILN